MKVIINSKETEIQAKTVKELAQELDLPATIANGDDVCQIRFVRRNK